MKTKKIILAFVMLVCVFSCCNILKAVEFPSITEVADENIETQNYDKNNFPDMRNEKFTMMVYAYINPAYGRGVGNNSSLPEPFTEYHTNAGTGTQTFFVGYFYNEAEGRYNAYLLYCSGYRVIINTGANVSSQNVVYGWGNKVMTEDTKNLVSLALIYGFDADMGYGSSGSEAAEMVRNDPNRTGGYIYGHVRENFATQMVVWLASTNQIGTADQNRILEHYCKIDGELDTGVYNTCVSMCNKILTALKMPSYSAKTEAEAPVYEMKWNAENSRFEYVLNDTNGLGTADKVDITFDTANTGLNVEKDGNKVTIWSKTPVGTKNAPVTLKLRKDINGGKGVAAFWQDPTYNNGDPSQPMTRLVDLDRTPEYAYVKVYAESLAIRVEKKNVSTSGNLGDATVKDATFGIYSDKDCKNEIARITTDANGNAQSEILSVNKCYIKEIVAPTGTNLSPKVYEATIENCVPQSDGTLLYTIEAENEVKEANIKIIKKLGATDYDKEINLSGVQFKVTLDRDNSQVYYSNISGEDGICYINNIPYGKYTVTECIFPDEAYKVVDFPVSIETDGKTYEYTKVDPSKKMRIEVEKVLLTETVGKTDAKASGAYFTVYRDEACTDRVCVIGPTDANGYAISGTMRTGKYYVKETTFPEGIDPDALIPGENVTYRDKVYVAEASNKEQGEEEEIITISINSIVNKPNMGSVQVIKYDNQLEETDEAPAKGAVLRLTLDSNPNCYYEATINENGYAEFVNEDLREEYYPYTIPYGVYTITEVKASDSNEHTSFFLQPEKVSIRRQEQKEYRILADEPVEMYLEVQKVDKVTGERVGLAGAGFKIWDCEAKDWVTQHIYPSGEYRNEFITDENGHLTLPHKIKAGEYIVYETIAPEGYYIQDEWRVPEKESDIGNPDKGGKYVLIDKAAMDVEENTPANKLELYYEVEIPDSPLMGRIQVVKTGEMLTDVKTAASEYGELIQPDYTYKALEGVEYTLTVKEDIKSPDGRVTYAEEGRQYVIKTNSEGIATSEELYLGTYEIEETKTPLGFVTDKDIPDITLVNENQYERVKTTVKDLQNVKQKVEVEINKEFEKSEYIVNEDETIKVAIGIYNRDAIKNYNQTKTLINTDDLIDVVSGECDIVGNKIKLTSEVNLPAGKYYAKEIYVDAPYILDETEYEFEVKFTETESQKITIAGPNIYNSQPTGKIILIKLSTSSLGNVTLEGDKLVSENADEKMNQILEDIKGLTEEEIKDYLETNNIKFVAGAEYSVFVDEKCEKPLLVEDGTTHEIKEVKLVTDDSGLIKVENIPVGKYYLKETKAPAGYKLSEEVVEIILTKEDKDNTVYKALKDESVYDLAITKLDAFTGEPIAKCKFEVRDEEGNLLVYSVTDEKGEGYIPLDVIENGKKYTYTEIEAPDIYDLNTTPHEFTASYYIDYENERVVWTGEKAVVENRRKTIDELIVRKIDEETGEPLEGCKFSIVLLDENGEPYVNNAGEMVYLVKDAVTEENGEYMIGNPYYGTYKFIEVEAPEGYEMTEKEMEGYVFTIDENSPDSIIFEVTNTGDIAVIALVAVAVASIIGIAFVIIRNKKQRA